MEHSSVVPADLDGGKRLSKIGGATLLSVACLTIMVGCVIVPGLPAIAAQLGVRNSAEWLITLPALGVVLFSPVVAAMSGRCSMRTMTCVGLAAYGATGFGGAFLEGPTTVFLDRILLGGATALIWTGGTGLISQFYVGEHRLVMLARQGMAIELGGVVFLVAGGTLASLGWRWPFTLYLFAWLLLAMVLAFIPKVATASQTKTVHCAQSTGSMSTIFLAGGASMCAFFTAIVLLPEQLGRRGFTAAQTGYFLAGVSLVAVVTAAALPATLRRLSPGRTLAVAFLCYAAAHWVIAFADHTYWYFAAAVLLGCGFGLSIPLVNHLTVELSSSSSREINLSRLCMAVFAGQFAPSLLVITLNSPASASLGMAVLSALMATVMLGQRHLLKPQ